MIKDNKVYTGLFEKESKNGGLYYSGSIKLSEFKQFVQFVKNNLNSDNDLITFTMFINDVSNNDKKPPYNIKLDCYSKNKNNNNW